MKIVANDYETNDIIRIIREWAELSPKEFGKTIHRAERTIYGYENGSRSYTINTLMDIAKKHGLKITIEKIK